MRNTAALALLLHAAACRAPTPSVSPQEFSDQFDAIACEHLARCGTLGVSQQAACVRDAAAFRAAYPEPWSLVAAVAAGHVAFDGERAATCLNGFRGAGCNGFAALQFEPWFFAAPSAPVADALLHKFSKMS